MIVKIDILKSSPYFSNLSEDGLNSISNLITCRTVQQGETFHYQGEYTDSLHFVAEGMVKAHKISYDGGETIWRIAVPVESLNDICFFRRDVNYGNMTAITPTVLYLIKRIDMYTIFRDHPQVALNAIKVLSDRAYHFLSRSDCLNSNIIERLAKILMMYSDYGKRNVLSLTQQDVADIMGTSRASANRSLKLMEHKGAIRLKRHCITIIDKEMLGKVN